MKKDSIDYELEEACKGTMLDPKYPYSICMPVLQGKLLERFLERLDNFEKTSKIYGKYIEIA
jgi:hypothetical protein